MRVVAVDATERGAIEYALLDGRGLTGSGRLPADSRLELAVAELLTATAVLPDGTRPAPTRPDAVVIVTGPGSLTGIRIAMGAALGLASACGVPVHGVGSLEVAALAGGPDVPRLLAVRDAGRGGRWVATMVRGSGGGLVAEGPPQRVEAGWQAPPGSVVAAIPAWPSSTTAGGLRPLALAVELALSRPPLDLATFDPATGRRLDAAI